MPRICKRPWCEESLEGLWHNKTVCLTRECQSKQDVIQTAAHNAKLREKTRLKKELLKRNGAF